MNKNIAPISTVNRLPAMDFLRGVAILAILLINIES